MSLSMYGGGNSLRLNQGLMLSIRSSMNFWSVLGIGGTDDEVRRIRCGFGFGFLIRSSKSEPVGDVHVVQTERHVLGAGLLAEDWRGKVLKELKAIKIISVLNLSRSTTDVRLSVIKLANRTLYVLVVRCVISCSLQCSHSVINRREGVSQFTFG
jgi:hypothetical protein